MLSNGHELDWDPIRKWKTKKKKYIVGMCVEHGMVTSWATV